MTDYEIYDKFFADEEYDLEKCTVVAYSYWSGWNSGLKRASILIRNEIRPHGKWINHSEESFLWRNECPICNKRSSNDANFCQYCGADMRKGDTK